MRGHMPATGDVLGGQTRWQTIKGGVTLRAPTCVAICRDGLMTLASLHAHAMVDRDLTPANLFLSPRADSDGWVVKILDFGLSRETRASATRETSAERPI